MNSLTDLISELQEQFQKQELQEQKECEFQDQENRSKLCSKTKKNCCTENNKSYTQDGKNGSLGIYAKSSGPYEQKNRQKTEENKGFQEIDARDELFQNCLNFKHFENGDFQQDFRLLRFLLQRISRKILLFKKNPKGKNWRTVSCMWSVITDYLTVLHSLSMAKSYFGGLSTCGSVWACPVCSSKISEKRKTEVVTASNLHKEVGGGLYMVTMTWAHSRHDDLQQMVNSSREALRKLRIRTAYLTNLKTIGYVGMIRSFEVTHGDVNGWHPHFHELWFVKEKLTDKQLFDWKRVLFEQWWKQCVKAKLGEPNRTVGITIIEAESAAEYVSKFGRQPRWDVGSELTKHQKKNGKNGNRSPWDLLRLYGEGQERFAPLFYEYVSAFFGARQLYWSNGFKKLFGIADMTDEEIAQSNEDDVYEICRISKEDWKKVLAQPYEARTFILELAETGGTEAVQSFIDSLS